MAQQLGKILLREKLIDEALLEAALEECASKNMRLEELLIKNKGVSEERVYYALSEQFSMPFIQNIEESVDYKLLKELPVELFKTGRCLPLSSDDNVLKIVVGDPLDLDVVMEAELLTGLAIETSLAMPSEMSRVCEELFKDESLFSETVGKISREYEKQFQAGDETQLSLDEIRKKTESEPVVKMVTLIFDEAISQRASDIHVEPLENKALIRFRVDGMLRHHMDLSGWMYNPLTSRIKILAELDIAEKRVPQDGRIRYSYKNNTYDFRVSTLPTHFGEKTVIRLLKHDLLLLELKNLGIEKDGLEKLYELIEKPQGMIFVTGPTGSGKSSTLFACLNRIRGKQINITTIENPIEYKLEGVNQVQINEKAGVTFATTLRSILRQDPDVILVGEIRDSETATIAMQASQTGHLVLSTLHTNDAVSAITRLRDLGIPGFLMSSSLLAVIAQRLVRVLCPHCKKKEPLSDELKLRWKNMLGEIPFNEAYFPVGCNKCGKSGFLGRKGIFEMIPVNDDIRSMVTENVSENKFKKYLRENGMKTIVQSGIEKVKQGVTTPEEVIRVVLVEKF